jgi:hypothetical protein
MGLPHKLEPKVDGWGWQVPSAYIFMLAGRPAGPLRERKSEAVQDAIDAGDARYDHQYRRTFLGPLTQIVAVYP